MDAQSEAALADHIRAERIRFVFIQSPLPIFFSPVAAAILSLALWQHLSHALLLGWTIGLAVIAVLRVLLVRTYPKENPSRERTIAWERTFVASIVLVDLFWGIGGLLLLVPDALAQRALVFCFLMLMASGHASSYAAHPATVLLGVLALTVPITFTFALVDDVAHRALAFAAVMYLAATFRSVRTLGFFFTRTHRLAHELDQLARTDVLSGLNNRRAFQELGAAQLQLARRHQRPAALLMFDIDKFKSINDKHGHAGGDAVIKAMAEVIKKAHRGTDIAGRLGGEEFAVLLPETAIESALQTAERLRVDVSARAVEYEQSTIRFTTSIGVAALQPDESLEQLIARADAALYEAKNAGRDRVMRAP